MEVEGTEKMAPDSAEFVPFSTREFRKSLWTDTEMIGAMQQFVKRSRKRHCEDVVLEYLKESSSSDGTELTRLLGEKLPFSQVIFLRICDDLQSEYSRWSEMVVGQLLQRGPIHNFMRALTPTNPAGTIVSALRLLTAMVMVSPSSVRTMSSYVTIGLDHLRALLERSSHSVRVGEDVRSCTIVYIMSFFMVGGNNLIRQHIEDNGALNVIFPSLVSDNAQTIHLFLSTLLSKVVRNSAVSKTSKLRLFKFKNLKIILNLFHWKGQKQRTKNKKHLLSEAEEEAIRNSITKEDHTQEAVMVQEIAFQLLETVCCSTKDGIVFADRNYGKSGGNRNLEITKLLSSSMTPYDNPLVEDLFVSIVSALPDQLFQYLPKLATNLVLRLPRPWIRTMSFVRRIFEAQRPMEALRFAENKSDYADLVRIALLVTTTSVLNKNMLNKILTHEEYAVRHQVLLFLSTMLEKAQGLLDIGNPEFRAVFVKDEDIRTFVKLYNVELLKKLPPWYHIVRCWDRCWEHKTSLPLTDGSISVIEHAEAIVNTVDRYFSVNIISPDQQVDFLTRNLLPNFATLESEQDEHRDKIVKIQLTTLRLLGDAKLCELALSKSVANKSIVSVVCKISSRQDLLHPSVKTASCELLRKLLFWTKTFEGVEHEVDIWVKAFQNSNETETTDLLSAAFDDLVRDDDVFVDSKLLKENSVGQCNQLLNDIFKDDVEDSEITDADVVDDAIGFSAMVLAVLRRLESSNQLQCRKSVARILIDILHCQDNPRPLCDLMSTQYGHVLPKKCVKYISYFNSDVATTTPHKLEEILERNDLNALVREAFMTRSAPPLSYVTLELLKDADTLCLLSRQLLAYLKVIVPTLLTELIVFFCDVLKMIVALSEMGPRVANLILSHPIVMNSFLHDDMLTGECPAHEALTQLALQAVNYVGGDSHQHVAVLLEKVRSFIFKKLHLLIDGSSERFETTSLVDMLTPFEDKLTTSNLRDFVKFLSSRLSSSDLLTTNKKSLNDVGNLLVHVLRVVAQKGELILTTEHVVILADLHKEISRIAAPSCDADTAVGFADELLRLFESTPAYAFAVDPDFLVFCLENEKSPAIHIEIADVLVRHNISNYSSLEEWLSAPSSKWRQQPGQYACIVGRYLKYRLKNGVNDQVRIILRELSKTYWRPMADAMIENDETAAGIVQSLGTTVSLKRRTTFCKRVAESGSAFSTSSLEALRVLLSTLSKDDLNNVEPAVLFVKVCLTEMMTSRKFVDVWNQEGGVLELVTKTLLNRKESLSGLHVVLQESKLLKWVIKASLKAGLQDGGGRAALEFLQTLLECLRHNGELDAQQSSLVYEMVFGHSNFLPRILKVTDHFKWKIALLDLLVFLVKTNSSVCKAVHVPILLAAYDGYLRSTDERLLRLLYLYESNGVDMHSYRPFVWGQTAVQHYSVLKHMRNSLWKQPKMEEILGLLDSEAMLRTALNFPLAMDLQVESYASDAENPMTISRKELVYDPRFLLPLFSHLLSPEALVQCARFIDCNGLAVAFASLCSNDVSTRSTGCYILSCFRHHLEGRRARNSLIWIYVLDIVRNAFETNSKPMPPMMAVFLTRTCQLLQVPISAVAQPVLNYLFVRSHLDMETVPEFYVLFSSSEVKHNIIRYWILDVLADGLRTPTDFKLCQKRLVFKIILSFFESPLSNTQSKCKILGVLNAATKIVSVAEQLINRQGILAFLTSAVRKFGDNAEIVTEIIGVISSAWTSVNKVGKGFTSSIIRTEFLLILVSILDCLNASTTLSTFGDFTRIVASTLTQFTNDARQYNAPGITANWVKKLLDFYGSIVGVDDQLLLTGDQAAIEEARTSIYEILVNWRSIKNKTSNKTSVATNYGEVFFASLNLLLKEFPACPENYEKLVRIYSWLSEHISCDSSGNLTTRLVTTSDDTLSHLFKSYVDLLIAASEESDVTAKKSSVTSDAVLLALNAFIVAVGKNWMRVKISDYSEKPFPKLVEKIDELLSDGDQQLSPVSFGVLVCELWIGKRDANHYRRVLRSASENVEEVDNVEICSVISGATIKRKSAATVEEARVKKHRTS